ncbi:hypothetical protein FRC11_008947, partial [Ceratobasidium sp. 423]
MGLRRLTIFVQHGDSHDPGNALIDDERRNTRSTLGKLCAMGARVILANDQTKEFIKVLETYAQVHPFLLPVQQDRPNIITELEDILHEVPAQARSGNPEERIRRAYERKLQDLRLILDAKESDLEQYREAFHQAEKL